MVRLRAWRVDREVQQLKTFNSNMVRLRVKDVFASSTSIKNFQFQYGAVKSAGSSRPVLIAKSFQFQYGAVKR